MRESTLVTKKNIEIIYFDIFHITRTIPLFIPKKISNYSKTGSISFQLYDSCFNGNAREIGKGKIKYRPRNTKINY